MDILRSPEAYDYLFLEAALPVVRQNLTASDQLPLGVSLTDEEILGVVKDALPLQWYQSQVSVIVGQLFAYLGGEEETLELRLFRESGIPWNEIAFPVIGETLRLYVKDSSCGVFPFHMGNIKPK